VFELSGGCTCLDFANTLDERRTEAPKERLVGYGDVVDWAVQAGGIGSRDASVLKRFASDHAPAGARALGASRAARDTLFSIFSALARGVPVPPTALGALNRLVADALRHRSVGSAEGAFSWQWAAAPPDGLRLPIWLAALSGAELLTSPDRRRVRQCEGAGCAWLFVDRSRNGSRRWCDMSVCGNRAKARRHHAKSRAARSLR
jgi:predicted RNA-binding Zn ribbon-like protein